MNRFDKKSQAAMEFLMTYGWAILIVLIVLVALFLFGVFDPGSSKNKCESSDITRIFCDDVILTDGTSLFKIKLSSSPGLNSITYVKASAIMINNGNCAISNDGDGDTNAKMVKLRSESVTVECNTGPVTTLIDKEKFEGTLTLTTQKLSELDHNVIIKFSGKVEP